MDVLFVKILVSLIVALAIVANFFIHKVIGQELSFLNKISKKIYSFRYAVSIVYGILTAVLISINLYFGFVMFLVTFFTYSLICAHFGKKAKIEFALVQSFLFLSASIIFLVFLN